VECIGSRSDSAAPLGACVCPLPHPSAGHRRHCAQAHGCRSIATGAVCARRSARLRWPPITPPPLTVF